MPCFTTSPRGSVGPLFINNLGHCNPPSLLQQYQPEVRLPHSSQEPTTTMFSATIVSFLQLWLATLAFAAPLANEGVSATGAKPWQYGTGGGVIGFIILILDILVWSTRFLSFPPSIYHADMPFQLRSCSRTVPLRTSCFGVSSSSSSPSSA